MTRPVISTSLICVTSSRISMFTAPVEILEITSFAFLRMVQAHRAALAALTNESLSWWANAESANVDCRDNESSESARGHVAWESLRALLATPSKLWKEAGIEHPALGRYCQYLDVSEPRESGRSTGLTAVQVSEGIAGDPRLISIWITIKTCTLWWWHETVPRLVGPTTHGDTHFPFFFFFSCFFLWVY